MISLLISSSLIIFLYADSGYETYEPQSYYDGQLKGCCYCTNESDEPYCNEECDNTICAYEPFCCNNGWDKLCAELAFAECTGEEFVPYIPDDYYKPPPLYSAECCECTESSDSPFCNQGCDATICEYDPYCCNVEWDWICANAAKDECAAAIGYEGDYGYESGPGDYNDYGYDDQCNCDEICYGQEPEDWEFEYEEVPPCIINNCGQQLDKCASDDSCVSGIEGIVSKCYEDNEDPMQCMDGLVQDTENNGFTQLCDGNTECGADLKSLGECVVNSANYGFCPEEEYKKLKLKSVLKTIKKRSRSRKRKSAAAKQKLSRKSRKRTKKRGKRASKLRASRRKLQSTEGADSYSDEYENPEYDYGCYCDCGDEEEEIPPCIIDNCGEQLYACGGSDDCINGVEGVIEKCYEDNDSPQECMDELMKESNGAQAIELCNGNEEAAGDLQALGTCVINSANYGFCSEDEYKKLKIKALVKATKKVRARKAASKQRKARLSRRQRAKSSKARVSRARSQRSRKVRQRASRARAQRQRQRKARARAQRSRKVKARKSRRKLQSTEGGEGCCECTNESDEPYCNEECDNTICSYDPYCCNEEYGSWDWICAASAAEECSGDDNYEPPVASAECCDCTDESGSPFCNEGCDANICSYDPYCCNVEWDWICANAAKDECAASGNTFDSGDDSYQFDSYNYGPGGDYGTDSYDYGGDSYDYNPYNYGPSDSYYDGNEYPMPDSYDFSGYGEGYGLDSYYNPSSGPSKRSRRVQLRQAGARKSRRAQRQSRRTPRSRARVSRQRRGRRQGQRQRSRRARALGRRQRARRTRR